VTLVTQEPTSMESTSVAVSELAPAPRAPWLAAVLAGVAAGLLGFGAGEAIHGRYAVVDYTGKPPLDPARFGASANTASMKQQEVKYARDDATWSFGALGAILGVALGLAGGLATRHARRAALAVAVGLVLGGLAGAGVSFGLVQAIYAPHPLEGLEVTQHDMMRAMLLHGGIGASIGAAAGLAFGIGLGGGVGRALRTLAGGLLGGAVAGALYQVAGAPVLPVSAKTYQPVALEWVGRLALQMAIALLAALGACAVASPGGRGRDRGA
jgi:hypothetical protein